MNKIIQRLVLIVITLLIIVTWNSSHQKVYASTEAEQLTMLLDQYKNDIGNMEQFRAVIDELYNDLNSATEVNDELKAKLHKDIDMLAEVDGMNPLILNVLDVELRAQVDNLTDETLPEMKEMVLVIKQWADAQETTPSPTPTPTPEVTPTPDEDSEQKPTPTPTPSTQSKPSAPKDDSTITTDIPKAGISSKIICLLVVFIIIVAVIVKIKYKNLTGI